MSNFRRIRLDAFNAHPEDLNWRARDTWLRNIESGLRPIQDELIPVLEAEAVRILKRENNVFKSDAPDRRKDPEGWRLWWLNEAYHLSHHTGFVPDAIEGPGTPASHAVNVLTAASELRMAMERGDVEKTAVLAILLVTEALQGGYSLEHEKAKEERDKAKQNGIGKINDEYARIRLACVAKASDIWGADPSKRIGEVADEILDAIFKAKASRYPDIKIPSDDIIKVWLIDASKKGKLAIPPNARKGGRPKKK